MIVEEIDPEGQPRNAGEMTKDGLLAYQIDMSVHRDELKRWERSRSRFWFFRPSSILPSQLQSIP